MLAFLRGDLEMTEYSFLKQVFNLCHTFFGKPDNIIFQDNISKCIVGSEKGSVAPVSLEQLEQMEREGKLLLKPLPTVSSSSKSETVRVKRERSLLTQEEIDALAEKRRKEIEEMREVRAKEQQMWHDLDDPGEYESTHPSEDLTTSWGDKEMDIL